MLLHRLSRRADRGVRRRRAAGRTASTSGAWTPGLRHAHRRAPARAPPRTWPAATVLRHLRRRRGRHRPARAARPSTPPHGDAATMTVVRPGAAVRRRRARRPTGACRGLPREAALGALGQRRLLLLRARVLELPRARRVLEREPLERPRRRRPAARLPPRGLLGLHGHLQGRGAAQRPVGRGRGPVEALVSAPGVSRAAFVTGAYGMLGAWLVARAARARRARRRAAARRAPVGSALETRGPGGALRTSSTATSPTRRSMARALGEYEVDTVFHLAAQTIVGTAQPLAPSRRSRRTCAAPGPCSRRAALRRRRARRRRRLRQGLRAARRRCPTPRTCRCSRRFPTTCPRPPPT